MLAALRYWLAFACACALLGCKKNSDEDRRAYVRNLYASVQKGGTIPRYYPPLPANMSTAILEPREYMEATLAIRASTGIDVDPVVTSNGRGESCVNATLSGPGGKRNLGVLIHHHGDETTYGDPVKNVVSGVSIVERCTCSRDATAKGSCHFG